MGMQDLTSKVENAAKLVGLHVNAGKTKMMIMGNLPQHGTVTVSGNTVENVDEFCYLGSIIQDDSGCDKDITARLGKAYFRVFHFYYAYLLFAQQIAEIAEAQSPCCLCD